RNGRPVGDLPWQRVHGLDRGADGQRVPIAVEDRAALRAQRDGLRVLALREPGELIVAEDLEVAQPEDDGDEQQQGTTGQDERTARIAGRRLRHGLGTGAGAAAGKAGGSREARPSGRALAVTAMSPRPTEGRSFPGGRPRWRCWPVRVMNRSGATRLLEVR